MDIANQLKKFNFLPLGKMKAINLVLGQMIPLISTMKLNFLELSPQKVITVVGNRRRVQNHLKQVHAIGTAMAIETATGFVVAMNLDATKIPLLKSISINYIKRASGDITASATLTREQVAFINHHPKGEVVVDVAVVDSEGQAPVSAQVTWAWIPLKK